MTPEERAAEVVRELIEAELIGVVWPVAYGEKRRAIIAAIEARIAHAIREGR